MKDEKENEWNEAKEMNKGYRTTGNCGLNPQTFPCKYREFPSNYKEGDNTFCILEPEEAYCAFYWPHKASRDRKQFNVGKDKR